LREEIASGRFREDLYFRLNVISLEMPPLRSRREDISLLATYFVAKYAEKCKHQVTGISPEARSYLLSYGWPGNVRELENAIERAVVLGSTSHLLPEDLPEAILERAAADSATVGYHEAVNEAKRQIIRRAMEEAQANYAGAAKLLGIHPNNLHRLIKSLDMKSELRK
jgi:DNA-binding NtrC family response regulator